MATKRSGANGAVSRGNRALRIALVVSLAAHVVALAVFPDLRESAGRQLAALPPLVARLVSPPVAPEAPAPAVPSPAAAPTPPTPQPPPRRATQAVAVPTPVPEVPPPQPAVPAPQVAMAAPAAPPVAPATAPAVPSQAASAPVSIPTSPAPSAPPAATRAAIAPAPAQAPAPGGADPSTIEQYRLAIITAGARYKAYPRVALDNNWTGTARVRLVVGPAGETVSLAVDEGSGHAVLDRAALEMVSRGKPQVPVPERLRGRRFSVEIPVKFELN
ncbi:MAG TPA: energy transducer TonB [Burkholderiales bacterium]